MWQYGFYSIVHGQMMDSCEDGDFQLIAKGILTSQERQWSMKLVSWLVD
jgi:hypothetical protein